MARKKQIKKSVGKPKPLKTAEVENIAAGFVVNELRTRPKLTIRPSATGADAISPQP